MISYDNKDWQKQIAAWQGTILPAILPRIGFLLVWTVIVVLLYDARYIGPDKKIDMVVYNVVGLALGLLLVFRTNTSYDRYWEGRRLLGGNVNASRNLALLLDRQLSEQERELRGECAELLVAFNLAVKERLRNGVKNEHLGSLRPALRTLVMGSAHVPLAILRQLHLRVQAATADPQRAGAQVALNNELTTLSNNLGGMERIRNTPIPFAYASHIQLFILLYFLALPFGLYDKFKWMSVPVVAAIALVLLGINEIGVEIEDPFGTDPNDLPIDEVCRTIEQNVRDLLGEKCP